MTTGRRVTIRRGFRLKGDKLVKSLKHLDVSARLRQASSRKVRVVRRRTLR